MSIPSHRPFPSAPNHPVAGCLPSDVPACGDDSAYTSAFEGYPCGYRIVRRPAPVLDPVVIIGGALQNKDSWWTHQRHFGPDADVITVDLPGSGSSGILPARYSHDFQAAALEHLLTEADVTRVNLVGVSYGSIVAYRLAQRRPDMVTRMVLNGVFDGVPSHVRATHQHMVKLLDARRTFEFAEAMLSFMAPRSDGSDAGRNDAIVQMVRTQFSRMPEDEVEQCLQNALRNLAHPRLRPCTHSIPTLVVTGQHDLCTPPETGRRIAGMIPDSVCVTFDDAGHLVFLEHPERFVKMLRHFFSSLPTDELPHCTPF